MTFFRPDIRSILKERNQQKSTAKVRFDQPSRNILQTVLFFTGFNMFKVVKPHGSCALWIKMS